MATNVLMSEQHAIFRRLQTLRGEDAYARAKALEEREAKETTAENERSASNATYEWALNEITDIEQTAWAKIEELGWDKNIERGTSSYYPGKGDLLAEMRRCRDNAARAKNEIASSNSSRSGVSTGANWAASILAIFLCVILMFAVPGGGVILGLLLGIGLWFLIRIVIVNASKKPLQDSYATLLDSVLAAKKIRDNLIAEAQTTYQNRLVQIRQEFEQKVARLDKQLLENMSQLRPAFLQFRAHVGELGDDWQNASWAQWKPAEKSVQVTRIGEFRSMHSMLPSLPAMLDCPGYENLLFEVSGDAKQRALQSVQSIMLYLLATQPPGKVRFTLLDPVGLGQNVAPFMQLTKLDEKLVGGRAWSETKHIEQQLADLSEHMSDVIQKYLRGQYETIEDYNAKAGEVQEPYRILVVTGFPVKFSPEAATRLVEIATNGPRCGVFTIVVRDTEQPLPYDFNLDDLKRVSVVVTQNGNSFEWQHPDFAGIPLRLDVPPPVSDEASPTPGGLSLFNHILVEVGEKSKEASIVRVPFDRVAPPVAQWWQKDTSRGIRVSLGRVGAKDLQYIDLGGKEHHVLLAGKTGSGKTNLLHVLLINLALTYSPDELELYLIDFKTVGFTPYARFKLPHARVVATQSEREFALSVLQKLDATLEERKKIFSNAGVRDEHDVWDVQGIAEFRKKNPTVRMPRILLLVDEFQEFFTYDDKVAHEATLLLDRLVRQGRAFGMHILLGSQTLAGGYTPARATMGQMGVRIALQCEETDSRLILSDDNPAARLLSRPGEAIYNDHNGLVDSNTRFQSAWLSEDELRDYLKQIQNRMQSSNITLPWQQMVFYGDADARMNESVALNKALTAPYPDKLAPATTAWIGDPIAIKEPKATIVRFHAEAGNNLLMVGQQDQEALGMHISMLLSLTAQHSPQQARFYMFDFTPSDDSLYGKLDALRQELPHTIKMAKKRTLPNFIQEIHVEMMRRIDDDITGAEAIYLFMYGLQRLRDLRPGEDMGFSFGEVETTPSTAKLFAKILKDGPDVGIHTIAWCDTYANLTRTIERNSLREFELRIVFQMSPEDSTNLVDAPIANKLGLHRALLYDDQSGQLEKFIPYGVPSDEWIQEATASIRQKATSSIVIS